MIEIATLHLNLLEIMLLNKAIAQHHMKSSKRQKLITPLGRIIRHTRPWTVLHGLERSQSGLELFSPLSRYILTSIFFEYYK